jgi:hypothetical protein
MKATIDKYSDEALRAQWNERRVEERRREDELATLSAHLSAATARFVELAWELGEQVDSDDFAGWLGFRCGMTKREAREHLRVAEALRELPAIRAAFSSGALTFTKVRALTRVATPSSEERLLEVAEALTASQLERALRVYRRIATEEARETHELEFVSYHFDEDGSLYLRARLAAEDGTLLVKALDAVRERVYERRRAERAAAASKGEEDPDAAFYTTTPDRSASVEALVELAGASMDEADEPESERARLVVHVDAAALVSEGRGRCDVDDGPVISPETARRLGCDAELVTQVERDGLPLSVGRKRRTVPPGLRRVLEARDDETCCFPGCERRRHLQAHHRRHWADGGETSLDNLVLLCFHHHRLVHEGGYTIEDDGAGRLRFRNHHGVLCSMNPPRPPPGKADALGAENERVGLDIGPRTNRNGGCFEFHLGDSVSAVSSAFA